MDPIQAVLLFVILVLTILLFVLGIQVLFILRGLRTTVDKINKVLDNTGTITESVSEPLSFLSGLLMSGKSFSTLLALLRRKKGEERPARPAGRPFEKQEEKEEEKQ